MKGLFEENVISNETRKEIKEDDFDTMAILAMLPDGATIDCPNYKIDDVAFGEQFKLPTKNNIDASLCLGKYNPSLGTSNRKRSNIVGRRQTSNLIPFENKTHISMDTIEPIKLNNKTLIPNGLNIMRYKNEVDNDKINIENKCVKENSNYTTLSNIKEDLDNNLGILLEDDDSKKDLNLNTFDQHKHKSFSCEGERTDLICKFREKNDEVNSKNECIACIKNTQDDFATQFNEKHNVEEFSTNKTTNSVVESFKSIIKPKYQKDEHNEKLKELEMVKQENKKLKIEVLSFGRICLQLEKQNADVGTKIEEKLIKEYGILKERSQHLASQIQLDVQLNKENSKGLREHFKSLQNIHTKEIEIINNSYLAKSNEKEKNSNKEMLIVDVLKKLAASANYWSKKFKEFKNIQKSKKQVYAKNKRAWNKLMGEVMLEHRSIMNYDKHQTIENKKLLERISGTLESFIHEVKIGLLHQQSHFQSPIETQELKCIQQMMEDKKQREEVERARAMASSIAMDIQGFVADLELQRDAAMLHVFQLQTEQLLHRAVGWQHLHVSQNHVQQGCVHTAPKHPKIQRAFIELLEAQEHYQDLQNSKSALQRHRLLLKI
nr:uncharacterized protein LOC112289528 [Physcomitrium patens]|eukprot:XP_024390548.1 uncharacterized protein LOC112289528 [Physcomitrella patens]